MTVEELNSKIIKYYTDKNFKIVQIKKLGFFDRIRYKRLFTSIFLYNNWSVLSHLSGSELGDQVFYREVSLIDMNEAEYTKYIDINVFNNDSIEIAEFDSYEI